MQSFLENKVAEENYIFIYEHRKHDKQVNLGWYENMLINNQVIQFKLDTGAESSILPLRYFEKLGLNKEKIIPSSLVIVSYGNYKSKIFGEINLKCVFVCIKTNVVLLSF